MTASSSSRLGLSESSDSAWDGGNERGVGEERGMNAYLFQDVEGFGCAYVGRFVGMDDCIVGDEHMPIIRKDRTTRT